jgi:hypothetical protein
MKRFPGSDRARDDRCSNPRDDAGALAPRIDARRRRLLGGGAAAGLLAATAGVGPARAGTGDGPRRPGFASVAPSTDDAVRLPPGYRAQVVYAWGDPVDGVAPAFRFDAGNSAADQARQAGMHHDGMAFFPDADAPDARGLLAINHEYIDAGLLFPDGMRQWSADKLAKALAAHGVSIVHVARGPGGRWAVVPGPSARRITAATPMRIAGPAAGHRALRTRADPAGRTVLGTLANCAHGVTPWGTYLTCEENFDGYFSAAGARPSTAREARYGIDARGFGTRWREQAARFDLAREPNEPNRFGWVVEIDPRRPAQRPVKRSALGRFKHEGAQVRLAADGRVVVYMADDERNEYLYKFVSSARFDPQRPQLNDRLLDLGTLHVARFDADGRGQWLPLRHGQHGLTAAHGFADQAEVLVFARQAADRVGATLLDRPEWIAHHAPSGRMLVALTNNTRRVAADSPRASVNRVDGSTRAGSAQPPVDAANPRADNAFGHLLGWREDGDDAAATGFDWDLFMLGGHGEDASLGARDAVRGTMRGDGFAAPDGLWVDPGGLLWIHTDMSTSRIERGPYAGLGNNAMLACDVASREVRRFLVGPRGCELAGMAMTPDLRTLFVNIQHPGEAGSEGPNDPDDPRRISNWPDFRSDGRPRSATLVITRDDGGVIGS